MLDDRTADTTPARPRSPWARAWEATGAPLAPRQGLDAVTLIGVMLTMWGLHGTVGMAHGLVSRSGFDLFWPSIALLYTVAYVVAGVALLRRTRRARRWATLALVLQAGWGAYAIVRTWTLDLPMLLSRVESYASLVAQGLHMPGPALTATSAVSACVADTLNGLLSMALHVIMLVCIIRAARPTDASAPDAADDSPVAPAEDASPAEAHTGDADAGAPSDARA